MIKKYLKTNLLLFTVLIFILSCETIVDVELPKFNPMIVVNSINNPDDPWSVNLSLTKGALEEGKIKTLTNAKIELRANGNEIITFYHDKNGNYKSTGSRPKTKVNYKLSIIAEGYKTVTSNCIIPEPVPIENVIIDTVSGKYEYEKELKVTLSFTDIPNTDNYYGLLVLTTIQYSYPELHTQTFPTSFSSNDILIKEENNVFEPSDRTFVDNEAFFDDTILKGKNYKLTIYIYFDEYESNYELLLLSLNKDYYQYITTVKKHRMTKDNPFAEPVIVYSNIQNGLGIFGGYSSSKYRLY